MRRLSVALCLCSLLGSLVAFSGAGASSPRATQTPTLHQCTTLVKSEELTKGHLTIATDNPVYAPWFINNTPSNGQGYESAMAYALAAKLGVVATKVKWVTEPYADSYQAGSKDFDFDINEVVPSPAASANVTFSSSYYAVQQSLVAMKSDPIVKHHTALQLRAFRYGALAGSPALTYVINKIKPIIPPLSYTTTEAAENALESNKIDAIAVDTPTGYHMVTWDIVAAGSTKPLATQVGQFAANGDENYALVLQKKNPLAVCLNVAIAAVHNNGTVTKLTKSWLKIYTSVPTLKP